MKAILFQLSINAGTDHVFANDAANTNNIERVDYFNSSENAFTVEDPTTQGFLIVERGGNDSFKIAAITALDDNDNPSEFGTLHSVNNSDNQWAKFNEIPVRFTDRDGNILTDSEGNPLTDGSPTIDTEETVKWGMIRFMGVKQPILLKGVRVMIGYLEMKEVI
jgi:hypothetical protein